MFPSETKTEDHIHSPPPRPVREEQGLLGRVVPGRSEETDFLLQLVPLPEGQAVKVLDGHPEDAEELVLGQMSLQANGETELLAQAIRLEHEQRDLTQKAKNGAEILGSSVEDGN